MIAVYARHATSLQVVTDLLQNATSAEIRSYIGEGLGFIQPKLVLEGVEFAEKNGSGILTFCESASKTPSKQKLRNYVRINSQSLFEKLGPFRFANLVHAVYSQLRLGENC